MCSSIVAPGDVVRLRWPSSIPPNRNKYCLCVCLDENLFFIINTDKCREAPPLSQVIIYKEDAEFLSYDSYVDTHIARVIPRNVVENGAKHGVYRLSGACLERIKYMVEQHRMLPERIMKRIRANW